ncbi:MAG: RNA polymerase sigma factor [Planctomyces sp.]|nr:RNA polymerase sigma factor [Planctomyces sp.]
MNSGQSPSNDDADLVRRFIAGDRQAFDDLFALYAPQILAFLAARTDNLADAEDLLHDVWIKASTHVATFDGNNFRAWIFQIARNTLYDFSKSPRRRKKPSSINDEHEPGGEDDPSARISREEELTALQVCMNAVGGEFVEAVRRSKVDGESPEDIANDLGIDVGTIYSRIHRGKKKLLDCLEKKLK